MRAAVRFKPTWMEKYQKALSKREDYQPGRVDWDLAEYLYKGGKCPEQAASDCKHPFLPERGNPRMSIS